MNDLRLNRATIVDWAGGLCIGGRKCPLDHDGCFDRDNGDVLFLEVKRPGEKMDTGQLLHYARIYELNPKKIQILIITVSGKTRKTMNGECLVFDPISYQSFVDFVEDKPLKPTTQAAFHSMVQKWYDGNEPLPAA